MYAACPCDVLNLVHTPYVTAEWADPFINGMSHKSTYK